MNEKGTGTGYEDIDQLTGLYTRKVVKEEMEELLRTDSQNQFHLSLLRMWNIGEFTEEYGNSFALAMLENQAVILREYYSTFGKNVVLGRFRRDTFAIFLQWSDREAVEEQAAFVHNVMKNSYSGRNQDFNPQFTMATYHISEGIKDADTIIQRAECAVDYGQMSGDSVVVYQPYMETGEPAEVAGQEDLKLDGENLTRYDRQFVSFAVSLLSNSRDLDSSLDMLILRTGQHFGFDDVLISEFGEGETVRVTNKWSREQGVLGNLGEPMSLDDWDGFFSDFDANGLNVAPDVSKRSFSEKDRAFFEMVRIRGFFNMLLYSNDRPIGYIACCCRKPRKSWDQKTQNSLIQLSRLTAAFVMLRIQKREDRMQIEALSRDALTGVYQYPAFRRKVKKLLHEYDPSKTYAIIYSDITNFSVLNENFGYDEGNHVLREFARRIQDNNTANVNVCRLEGDRFVILSCREQRKSIEARVHSVNNEFARYLADKYPQSDFHITSGIYFLESPHMKLHTMIDNANHARKSVKKHHFGTVGIYTDALRIQRQQTLEVVGSVHDAIETGAIEAFLQPKFSMHTFRIVGAEALVRWRNPDGSFRFPDQFVPVLEEAGLIVDVDMCVYEQVLKVLSRWKKQGRRLIPISVNFSRVHFRNPDAYQKIMELASRYEISPDYIEVEITESVFNTDRANLYHQMSRLRDNGFKIDIDDFGTGYSSLNMLLSAPVDIVKVDKSFIDRYETESEKEYINQIGSLILSARKDIIFEGVETREQAQLLTSYGYDRAQGYLFSKPVSVPEFELLLQREEE